MTEPNERIGDLRGGPGPGGGPPGGTEMYPGPIDLAARADRVSAALNLIRNAVQGRGATPRGPAELAARVNEAQENWRGARAQFFDGANLIREAYETAAAIERWERLSNELADEAIAAGLITARVKIPVTHTLAPTEALERAGQAIASGAQRTLVTLAVFGLGLAAIALWGRR